MSLIRFSLFLLLSAMLVFSPLARAVDVDTDGDGVVDVDDEFPLDPLEWLDTDGDLIGNNADLDDDGDGVADTGDAFPLDSTETDDTDGDGVGNEADTDDDADGVPDLADLFPLDPAEWQDTDGDAVGDNADSDDDNDGLRDHLDAFPKDPTELFDSDGDGIGNNQDTDDDNDTVGDSSDNCPLVANADQADVNLDGQGNLCDPLFDNDGDSVANAEDWYPNDPARSVRLVLSDFALPDSHAAEEMLNLLAQFTVSGGTATGVTWDLGDGSTVLGTSVTHTYDSAGSYTISLTVETSDGQVFQRANTLVVGEARRAISGSVTGLANGQTLDLLAYSPGTQRFGQLLVQGDGSVQDFTVAGLAPADDYLLYWQSDSHPAGYFGGTPGAGASGPWGLSRATTMDLSVGDVVGVDLNLGASRTLDVTLTGTTQSGELSLMLWSENLGVVVSRDLTTEDDGDTALSLPMLPEASDYRLFIDPRSLPYAGGYFVAQGSAPGSLDLAAAISLDGTDAAVSVALQEGRSLAGTVDNLAAGERAVVEVWSAALRRGGRVELLGNGGSLAYTVSSLPPADDYVVEIRSPALQGGYFAGVGQALTDAAGAIFVDLGAANQSGVNLALQNGRFLSGSVNGLSGGAVAWLEAWSDGHGDWRSAQVNPLDGSYQFNGLHAEVYTVTLHAEGFANPGRSVDLSVADRPGEDFTVLPGAGVSGRLSGLPAFQPVTVRAASRLSRAGVAGHFRTDAGGAVDFLLEDIPPAVDVVVSVQSGSTRFFHTGGQPATLAGQASPLNLASGDSLTGVDFDLSGLSLHEVSGSVVLNGPSADDAPVVVRLWSDTGFWAAQSRRGSGDFSFSGVPSGQYRLAISANGHVDVYLAGTGYQSGRHLSSELTIGSDTNLLAANLGPAYRLEGVVTDQAGDPLAGAYVSAWNENAGLGGGSRSRSDGRYRIEGLDGGLQYQVRAEHDGGEGLASVAFQSLDVVQDLQIIKAPGEIQGTLSGPGAAGALLLVYREQGGIFVFAGAVTSAADGGYRVDGLESGASYRVDVDTDGLYSSPEISATADLGQQDPFILDLAIP